MVLCDDDVTQVTFFSRRPNIKVEPYVFGTLLVDQLQILSQGYTCCFRANFWTWSTNHLVRFSNLTLQLGPTDSPYGYLEFNGVQNSFIWRDLIKVSRLSWNSFCIVFNSTNFSVKLGPILYNNFLPE